MEKRHTLLLGGIGGDSHSVGLTILRQALAQNGYDVVYLGTQNRLADFFERAALCDVVMLSSMDGHTRYYVKEFPELMRRYQARAPLWYLGGNLTIGDALGYEAHFREMGFDRVFVKFVDVRAVLEVLAADLAARPPIPAAAALRGGADEGALALGAAVPAEAPRDAVMEPDAFHRARAEVLQGWKTGHAARSLEENARFLARQPSFAGLQAAVGEGRAPMLVQPRSGVPLADHQLRLFQAFRAGGAGVLSYQVDSLTRNNDYPGADEALRESRATGTPTLNGFPVINHGVPTLRRMAQVVGVPLQVRHSTRDPRLLAEVAYAGGATGFEGGAICYNLPYYKTYAPEDSIRAWQYVDRLTGLYHERFGIVLDREFFGVLTATLVPPSLAIATGILEAILAVQQGVRSVSLGYAEVGHRVQDVAAIRTLTRMARRTLANLGYGRVQVNAVFNQYMAAFPADPARAEELIYQSGVTAGLSGAARVLVKTPVEAIRIPTLEDNLHGLSLVMRGIAAARDLVMDEAAVRAECEVIEREVQALLDGVIVCGGGSVAAGIPEAFRRGWLDIPFSPSLYNRGEVATARDEEGAVRFLSPGRLPFDRALKEFHRDRMSARRHAEGEVTARREYLLVEQDVLRVPRCEYAHWPLFDGASPRAPRELAARVRVGALAVASSAQPDGDDGLALAAADAGRAA
ncbi:methylaspartate mutase subunit E [Longimicrobium sp.]|uniref:methylaspartate mutase subunit E n=1 Tax=Longimicrobium sp. TaxID=2029185 RepID=UPI002E32CB62|nr:methylaspartate mutase subunit E [Longimicrobium sp.]HEX6039913.1 methylaspartate mutase subunit E [Longimicrobium sp.]